MANTSTPSHSSSSTSTPPPTPTTARVIILGAGFGGLAAAKTYLQLHPSLPKSTPSPSNSEHYAKDLLLLDHNPSPGGTWSRPRLYPGLVAQSPNGVFEFSDRGYSMVDEGHGKYTELEGKRVGGYLEGYAERHHLMGRLRGGVRVVRVVRRGKGHGGKGKVEGEGEVEGNEGWRLFAEREQDGKKVQEVYECEKLIVASGLYNNPYLPLPAAATEGFRGYSIHSKQMGAMARTLQNDPKVKNVVVVGGNKSSIEACALFLRRNREARGDDRHVKVHWLVRPSDKGVLLLLANIADGKGSAETALSRAFGAMHMSNFDTRSKLYRFFHSGENWLGTVLLGVFWWLFTRALSWLAGWGRSENTKRLKPKDKGAMEWGFGSVVQIEPGHEVLKVLRGEEAVEGHDGRGTGLEIEVVRATMKGLRGRQAVIADEKGEERMLEADAVIWCTGWLPSVDFFEAEEAGRVGAPRAFSDRNREKQDLEEINERALQQTLKQFPRLRNSTHLKHLNDPQSMPTPARHGPYNLLRHIVSPWCLANADRSIAFVNMTATAATPTVAELSAMWSVAWMEGLIDPKKLLDPNYENALGELITEAMADDTKDESTALLDKNILNGSSEDTLKEAQYQTALQTTFMHLRWGQYLSREPLVILDVQGYLDQMCRDLGLRVDRKTRSLELDGKSTSGWQAWKKKWLEGYTSKDYDGIVEEFKEMLESKDGKDAGPGT